MAYRKKAAAILALKPDIVVVPECEHPDKLFFAAPTKSPKDVFWHGINPNKGLGILSYSDYTFKLHALHNPAFRHILPLVVTGDKTSFILFAVWANNPDDKDGQYVTQVWKAIHFYEKLLSDKAIILAGDFNSNTIWDSTRKTGNHSQLVEKLASKQVFSTYHHFFNQQQGREKHATWYMYRHKNKPYHLDYCFASAAFISKMTKVEVGTHRKWAGYSDHSPLTVTFDIQE
jgi:exodeoxyribonuclease III